MLPFNDPPSNQTPNDDLFKVARTKIKPNFASEDDIKKFLNNGGRIIEVPFGQSSNTPISHFQKSTKSQKEKLKNEHVAKSIFSQETPPSPPAIKPSNATKSITLSPQEVAEAIIKSRTSDKLDNTNISPKLVSKTTTEPDLNTVVVEKKDISKVIVKPPKPPKQPKQPQQPSEEAQRLFDLKTAKLQAIKNGEKTFTARCRNHGLTSFSFFGETVRCIICRTKHEKASLVRHRNKNPAKAKELFENSERLARNFMAYDKAIEAGVTTFIAECGFHGIGAFIFEKRSTHKTQGSYRCLECKKISHFIYRTSKKPA